MSALIGETLALFAESCGDPYEAVYERLYAARHDYEGLFLLDTDEGLRRNMMRTTLEIIATYLDDKTAAANRVVGARMSHVTYGVEDDFGVFFDITRDVIAEGCADIWTDAHTAAWDAMLKDFEAARV